MELIGSQSFANGKDLYSFFVPSGLLLPRGHESEYCLRANKVCRRQVYCSLKTLDLQHNSLHKGLCG